MGLEENLKGFESLLGSTDCCLIRYDEGDENYEWDSRKELLLGAYNKLPTDLKELYRERVEKLVEEIGIAARGYDKV